MLNGFITLIAYAFVGDIISTIFDLPIPGSIIGMILLLATFALRKKINQSVDNVSQGLISYIGLLFVPAGVGIIQYYDLIAQEWPVIIFTSITSMLFTLGGSATIFIFLSKKGKK